MWDDNQRREDRATQPMHCIAICNGCWMAEFCNIVTLEGTPPSNRRSVFRAKAMIISRSEILFPGKKGEKGERENENLPGNGGNGGVSVIGASFNSACWHLGMNSNCKASAALQNH